MKLTQRRGSQPFLWAAIGLAIGVVVVWHCWFASYNHDEIEHLHASWLIASGQLPFRDFLEQHHPTIWFLAAPIAASFASVRWLVFAARMFDVGCLVSVVWLLKQMLRRLYPSVSWQLPALLLVGSFMFVRSMLEFRPDPLMNVAVYGGLLNWIAFLQERRSGRAFAAGALFGLAVVVLQKAAVILVLVGLSGLLLIAIRLFKRDPIQPLARGLAIVIGVAGLFTASLFVAMGWLGIFKDFWFWNYPFNRFFYMQAQLQQHFFATRTIGLSILVDPVLWIAGAIGAYRCASELLRQDRLSSRDECRLTLLWVAGGYLGFLFINRFPLEQYFIVLLPLLAVFAAEAFHTVREGWQGAILTGSTYCMPLALIGILLLYPGNDRQLKLQDFLLKSTSAEQSIFVPPAFNPIFRRDAAYFWYNGDLISGAYQDYCGHLKSCPDDKLILDEKRWKASPPSFVHLHLPAYYPYHWSSRESAYSRTRIPMLWKRDTAIGPKASVADELRAPQ